MTRFILLRGLVAASIWIAGSAWAADEGPSFDCAKAGTPDEKLICASASLSVADRSLAAVFRATRDAVSESRRAALIAEQRQWVDSRNRRCGIDHDTILQPRVFFTAIPCMEDAMRSREKALQDVSAAAKTEATIEAFRVTGAYATELFDVPPALLSDTALIGLVARIPAADGFRALNSARATRSEALFGAILERFGPQWKTSAASRRLLLNHHVCRDAVWHVADAPHLALEPEAITGLFQQAAACRSLSALRRLASHPGWLAAVSPALRDDLATGLRLDTRTGKPMPRRDPDQLAVERALIGDPELTAEDWTAGEAIQFGVTDPERALRALARFDSARNLVWRVIYLHVSTDDPESRMRSIPPLLTQLVGRLQKPGEHDPFIDSMAEDYDGSLEWLLGRLAALSSNVDAPREDPEFGWIPCPFLIAHPEFFPMGDPYNGGMRDSRVPYFACDDYGQPMPAAVAAYINVADGVYLGGRYDGNVIGSIRYSYAKELDQKLIRIRLLPRSYLVDPAAAKADLDDIPLARWSLRSLWNRNEFETRAKPMFLEARQDLARRYQGEGRLGAADALRAAHLALWDYMEPTRRNEAINEPESPLNRLILDGRPATAIAAATDTTQWNDAAFWQSTLQQDPPLQNAVTRPDVVKALLDHKADPNIANGLGRTPLMTAALYDDLDSLELLLAAGADINRQSKQADAYVDADSLLGDAMNGIHYGRRSALMYAAANSRLPLIEALLAHGADRALKDEWGLTAQDYLLGRGPVPANPRLDATQRKKAAALLAPQ